MLARLSHLKQRFSSAPRYQRLLSYAVAFYLIYLLLLGLALPYIAKTQGPQQLATLLGRPVLLADVKINPFTLHISLDGFAVLEKNQQKFATIDHASVELNFWRSLFNGSINLKMIKLDGVSVAVTQFTAGHFNFSDIISHIDAQSKTSAQKPSAPAATNEQSAALPHIQIADIAISNSAVSYNDKPTGMRLSYPDINISLANFNSLAPLDKDYNSFIINIKGCYLRP